jgi:hypothetical protein
MNSTWMSYKEGLVRAKCLCHKEGKIFEEDSKLSKRKMRELSQAQEGD